MLQGLQLDALLAGPNWEHGLSCMLYGWQFDALLAGPYLEHGSSYMTLTARRLANGVAA